MFKTLARSDAIAALNPSDRLHASAVVRTALQASLPVRGSTVKSVVSFFTAPMILHLSVKLLVTGLVSPSYSVRQRESTDGFTFLYNRRVDRPVDDGGGRDRLNIATTASASERRTRDRAPAGVRQTQRAAAAQRGRRQIRWRARGSHAPRRAPNSVARSRMSRATPRSHVPITRSRTCGRSRPRCDSSRHLRAPRR